MIYAPKSIVKSISCPAIANKTAIHFAFTNAVRYFSALRFYFYGFCFYRFGFDQGAVLKAEQPC